MRIKARRRLKSMNLCLLQEPDMMNRLRRTTECELSELLVSIDWWGEGRSGQQKGSSNFVFLVGLLNLGGRLAFPFGFFYTKIIFRWVIVQTKRG